MSLACELVEESPGVTMTTAVGEEEVRVIISKGHMTAEMMVPAGFARDALSEQMCMSLLQQSGVEISDAVVQAVQEMVAAPPPSGEDQRVVLARATDAQRGDDGHVQWFVSEPNQSPADQPSEQDGDEEGDEVSHYDRSAYLVVKAGDVVGRVVEPTDGVDGRDVLGQTIAAKPGKPVILKNDESVMRDGAGQLIVQIDGVLQRENDSVCVKQLIEVPEYVDFSTGNIDFVGDVIVRQGVRDCFVVKATGNVEVRGLIEAATIDCGGSLVANGGMAGRERGYVQIGGDLRGKYLDNIQGQIGGALEIHREVINCELTIHGAIRSPRGTLIGGKMVVVGAAEWMALGSGAGVATELVLGSVPKLEPIAVELEQLIEALTAKRDEIEAQQKLMKKNTRMMTPADKERQTEIMFEHQIVTAKIAEGLAAQEALTSKIRQLRTVDLTIHKKLFHGTVLTIRNQAFTIREDTRGPLSVYVNSSGEAVYRTSDTNGAPLTKIAELKAAAV